MEIKEERLQSEIQKASISLVIDTYDDLFSDFDFRPYSERAISDDFLLECKRAARDKENGGFDLSISVPKNIRNLNEEFGIKKRLRDHFHKHHLEKEREIGKIKKEGFIWATLGLVILFGVLYGLLYFTNETIITIITMLELPCWFLTWEGLGKILIESRKLQPDHIFYQKMANIQIVFRSY